MKTAKLLACALVAVALPAHAAAPGTVAVYSNVCVHAETGDLLGTRIIVMVLGADDINILYALAQGDEGIPVVHWLSPDELKNFQKDRLDFQVDLYGVNTTVRGTVSDKEIVLTEGGFSQSDDESSPEKPVRLPRVRLPERRSECGKG